VIDLIETHLEEIEARIEQFDQRDQTGIQPDFSPAIALLNKFITFVVHMHSESIKEKTEQNFLEAYVGAILNVDVTFESYFRYNIEPPKDLDWLESISDSVDRGESNNKTVMQAIQKAVAKGLPESREIYLDKSYQRILDTIPNYQVYRPILDKLDSISDKQLYEDLDDSDESRIEALSLSLGGPSLKPN